MGPFLDAYIKNGGESTVWGEGNRGDRVGDSFAMGNYENFRTVWMRMSYLLKIARF